MEVNIKRVNAPYQMDIINERGNSVRIDAGPGIGGSNQGYRPMELVLAGLGGCSTFDVIHILGKQRQQLRDIEVKVTGEREADAVPSPFVKLHIHYVLYGKVEDAKAARAVDLAVNKYCSVGVMLEKSTPITYSYEIKE